MIRIDQTFHSFFEEAARWAADGPSPNSLNLRRKDLLQVIDLKAPFLHGFLGFRVLADVVRDLQAGTSQPLFTDQPSRPTTPALELGA